MNDLFRPGVPAMSNDLRERLARHNISEDRLVHLDPWGTADRILADPDLLVTDLRCPTCKGSGADFSVEYDKAPHFDCCPDCHGSGRREVRVVDAADLDDLLDTLVDVVNQACLVSDATLDSMGLSANADAMRLLARYGRLRITQEIGRRVIGEWAK